MELIEAAEFSELQCAVCRGRLEDPPKSYDQLSSELSTDEIKLHHSTISTILKRSALGFPWTASESKGGAYPYLCPHDLKYLKELATQLCTNDEGCLDPYEFLDMARDIKITRINKASQFLIRCKCTNLLKNIVVDETLEPSRAWINSILEELELSLEKPVYIDSIRIDSASLQRLVHFYTTFENTIRACPPQLLFGGDETMLSTTYRGKVLVSVGEPHQLLVKKAFKIPHITSMCVHTVTGVAVTPFLILPSLRNLPDELKEFRDSGTAWFASSPSGWMTRDIFFIWTLHFINWLSVYRKTLPSDIASARALLIMDGHSSRECPLALLLLRNAKVDVLILPGHTSHITQMFDVVLASPLKSKYTKLLNTLLKENSIQPGDQSQIGKARYLAVLAFITAWNSICTPYNCKKASEKCGFFPFNAEAISRSPYVVEFTDEQERQYQQRISRRTRFDINSKIITESMVLNEITNMVVKCIKLHYLCQPVTTISYTEFAKNACRRCLPNNCYFLGRLPPFVTFNDTVISFELPSD